jgi:integrase
VEHVVPLADQAIAILDDLFPLTGSETGYVFPSVRSRSTCMSDNSLNAALRRMGYTKDQMTAHGFRAMASTRLNELGFAPDIIEKQLAHAERNKVRAAYNHASYLPQRQEMMQFWADYLDNLKAGADIVAIGTQSKRSA